MFLKQSRFVNVSGRDCNEAVRAFLISFLTLADNRLLISLSKTMSSSVSIVGSLVGTLQCSESETICNNTHNYSDTSRIIYNIPRLYNGIDSIKEFHTFRRLKEVHDIWLFGCNCRSKCCNAMLWRCNRSQYWRE